MRLHLLGIPHTVTDAAWSHCAFTQKVRRFAPMMRPYGWQVIHYGIAGSVTGATEDVVLMDQDEHMDLLGHPYQHHQLYGADALDGSALYRQFNLYARGELEDRVEPGDLILLPFGHAHAAAIRGLPVLAAGAGAIESGIGYYETLLPWRIWESFAARHASMGREGRHGVSMESSRLEFTVPNYYDVTEWPIELGDRSEAPVVFMGRLTEGKGIATVLEVAARRPEVRFQIIGQGDASAWTIPENVEILGSMGPERAALLGQARAIIAPSRYIEPFCGSVVEAQLCGTPAITSDFGAFAETVQHGITGFHCQTVGQFTAAVDRVLGLDRETIARRARTLYAMERVGRLYDDAFEVVRQRLADGVFPLGW